MTKEQLCEYRELQKEIKRLQARIETSAMCDCGQTQAICVKPV